MDIWETNKLILFIAFFVPGVISIKVYSLLVPAKGKTATQNILDAVTYSCINYALLSWLIYIDIQYELYKNYPIWHIIILIVVLFLSPILLGFGYFILRKIKWISKHLQDPTPTPWDYAFGKRDGNKREGYWIILELTDGTKIGGKYGKQSASSIFPNKEQIFLQEVWDIKGRKFIKAVGRSKGVIVSGRCVKSIEFFR